MLGGQFLESGRQLWSFYVWIPSPLYAWLGSSRLDRGQALVVLAASSQDFNGSQHLLMRRKLPDFRPRTSQRCLHHVGRIALRAFADDGAL